MEQMDEAEREYRKDQQKFSMDTLAMLGNILKDISERKRMNTLFSIFFYFYCSVLLSRNSGSINTKSFIN